MNEISKKEIEKHQQETDDSAKELLVNYILSALSEKEDSTKYNFKILGNAANHKDAKNNSKPIKLISSPKYMANIAAKVLENSAGEFHIDDFVALMARANTNPEIQNYSDKVAEASIAVDSLIDYNFFEREKKEPRIKVRGTLKKILEGTHEEKSFTQYEHLEALKQQILEQEKDRENGIERKVASEIGISLPKSIVSHDSSYHEVKELKAKKPRLLKYFLIGSLLTATAVAGYLNKDKISNFIMGKTNQYIASVINKMTEEELKNKPKEKINTELDFAVKMLDKSTTNYREAKK